MKRRPLTTRKWGILLWIFQRFKHDSRDRVSFPGFPTVQNEDLFRAIFDLDGGKHSHIFEESMKDRRRGLPACVWGEAQNARFSGAMHARTQGHGQGRGLATSAMSRTRTRGERRRALGAAGRGASKRTQREAHSRRSSKWSGGCFGSLGTSMTGRKQTSVRSGCPSCSFLRLSTSMCTGRAQSRNCSAPVVSRFIRERMSATSAGVAGLRRLDNHGAAFGYMDQTVRHRTRSHSSKFCSLGYLAAKKSANCTAYAGCFGNSSLIGKSACASESGAATTQTRTT